jgi:hypothetical protein
MILTPPAAAAWLDLQKKMAADKGSHFQPQIVDLVD